MADNVIALSPLRAELTRAFARRGKRLAESARIGEEVGRLTELEAFWTVKELGLADAQAIVAHLRPEQLQACVDLDCWRGDELMPGTLDGWLAARTGEGDPFALAQSFLGLDDELQVLYLAARLTIAEAHEPEPGDGPGPPAGPGTGADDRALCESAGPASAAESDAHADAVGAFSTCDGQFLLRPRGSGELSPLALVDALYQADPHQARRLLTAARWSAGAETAEEAWRFRQGRLEDLGFPPLEEAQRLLAPPRRPLAAPQPAGRLPPPPAAAGLPALWAPALQGEGLFAAALATIADAPQLAAIEQAFVALVNGVTVAFGAPLMDLEQARAMALYVRDTVALGLACEGLATRAQAASRLVAAPLAPAFQRGYQRVEALATQARRLARDPEVAACLAEAEAWDDDYDTARAEAHARRAFLAALLPRQATWAGYDLVRPRRQRAFQSPAEVAEGESLLDAWRP